MKSGAKKALRASASSESSSPDFKETLGAPGKEKEKTRNSKYTKHIIQSYNKVIVYKTIS